MGEKHTGHLVPQYLLITFTDPTNTSAQGHALNILSRVESLESQHSTSRVRYHDSAYTSALIALGDQPLYSHSITSHLDKHLIISTRHVDKGATTHFLSSTPRMYPVPINLPEAEAREQIEVQIRAVERTTPEPSTQEMKGKGADEVVEPFTPGTRERVAGVQVFFRVRSPSGSIPRRRDVSADSWARTEEI